MSAGISGNASFGSSGSSGRLVAAVFFFAYRLQGEGVVPECFLVFLFDLQTLLLPILTIVLVQAYAIADEVLVGTGGSYDDTVDIGLIIPSVVADAYTGEHAAYRGNT